MIWNAYFVRVDARRIPRRLLSFFLLLLLWNNNSIVSSCISTTSSTTSSSATTVTSQQENARAARIFYLILIHNDRTLQDAVHLVRAIQSPRNHILIHIDTKAQDLWWMSDHNNNNNNNNKTNPLRDVIAEARNNNNNNNNIRVESKFDVKWSHWSMNYPTLWGMQVAVEEYDDQWDVWINLSGDTLPVYDANRMAEILAQLPYNFVTSRSCETGLLPTSVYDFPTFWHKRRHYTRDEQESDPVIEYREDGNHSAAGAAAAAAPEWQTQTMITYFGSQWVILQPDFCRWIVQGLKRPDSLPYKYRDYLQTSEKLMSDETFLASLLMNTKRFRHTLPVVDAETGHLVWKNGTLSNITDVRFERMDEHTPTSYGTFHYNQRYQVPESRLEQVEQPRPWGPYFLGAYDLAQIRLTGSLFCRKVTEGIDPNLVRLLPVHDANEIPLIDWPTNVELSLTPKPDWETKLKQVFEDMLEDDKERGQNERNIDDGEL